MPARRRRSLSRSPVERAVMWDKKMNPTLYSEILQRTKPLAMGKVMSYQVTHEQLITLVKRVIENFGSEGARTHEYMRYIQKITVA